MGLFGNEITTLGLSELRGSPLDDASIPINSPAIWDWMAGGEPTASGEQINEANSLQISTVYSCVRVIAESIAGLPCEVFERTTGGHEKAVDNPLFYLLTVEPNPEMSAFSFIETLTGSTALTGNGYAQIERNTYGSPVALWPLHPLKTEPVRAHEVLRDYQGKVIPKGSICYKTTDGMESGQFRLVLAEDMLHVPLFSFDGLKGISPIALARQSLGLAKAAEKFGARFFGNGSRPSGLLLNKGPKPDAKAQANLRESWQQLQGGANSGKMGFLFGGEWSYQQIGLSPEEAQFLATRAFQRADIAALFRVPPHFVGDLSRLSGNNSEQMMLQFVTLSLRPYLSKFEAELIRKLVPTVGRNAGKYFVQFDVSDLLRADFKTQQDGYSAGVQGGWYSPNDVRRKLGENPGGASLDVYRCAVNYQNSERLLDTESSLDQPVGGAPAPAPTAAERSMLGSYTQAYIALYKDAFNRLIHRNKRDVVSIDNIFRPLLRSISDTALGNNTGVSTPGGDFADQVITDCLRSMAKRVAKWPQVLSADEMTSYASTEFGRAVRSIHVSVSRELAAKKAVLELQAPDEEYLS